MKDRIALLGLLAAACGTGGEATTLEGSVEVAAGLAIDQIRVRQVLLGGQLVPGSEGLLFPDRARRITSGDTFTLRFDGADGGKTVVVSAEGLAGGQIVTAPVEASAPLNTGGHVRIRLRFMALSPDSPDAGGPDPMPPADAAAGGPEVSPDLPPPRPDLPPATGTCGPPGNACANPGAMCGYSCPNGGNVNCVCNNGSWMCPPCFVPNGCGPPGGACSSRGTTCTATCPGTGGEYSCHCSNAGTWNCSPCGGGGGPGSMCSAGTACVPNAPCAGECTCSNVNAGSCPGGNNVCRCVGGVLQCLCCGPRLFCPPSNPAAICIHRCPNGSSVTCGCPTAGGAWNCPVCQ